MGNYRIVINATGGHGQDREKGNGETVDFGEGTPESIIRDAVAAMQSRGEVVIEATVHHWPGTSSEVLDNLITGTRKGEF